MRIGDLSHQAVLLDNFLRLSLLRGAEHGSLSDSQIRFGWESLTHVFHIRLGRRNLQLQPVACIPSPNGTGCLYRSEWQYSTRPADLGNWMGSVLRAIELCGDFFGRTMSISRRSTDRPPVRSEGRELLHGIRVVNISREQHRPPLQNAFVIEEPKPL